MTALLTYSQISSSLGDPRGFFFRALFNPAILSQIGTSFSNAETARAANNAACNSATANSIFEAQDKPNCTGTDVYILGIDFFPYDRRSPVTQVVNSQLGSLLLIDRLSETQGLSSTSGSIQTTNLPTAALTRYTTGEGVQIMLEVYANVIGSSPQTASASYTNQAGVSGRTTNLVGIGGDAYGRRNHCVFRLGLQQGDTGAKSVESVTLSGSTGTVGNLGVVLYKSILAIPRVNFLQEGQENWKAFIQFAAGGPGKIPVMSKDACPQFLGSLSFAQVCGVHGTMYITDV